MNALVLLIFVGVVLVAFALGFFAWTVRAGSLQHADRLSLLPLRDDDPRSPTDGDVKPESSRIAREET